MKVFFTTTPRLKVEAPGVIDDIYSVINNSGHQLTSDYLKNLDVDDFYKLDNKKVPVYYEEILDALRKADVVVFEASLNSIGVGLLIKESLAQSKGVIILHKKGNAPFFLEGIKEDRFVISEYTKESLKDVLTTAFDYMIGKTDVRFNFFISPEIGAYLDWISRKKRVPRAVYLRKLIESDMNENKEFGETD